MLSGWLASRWSRSACTILSCSPSTKGTSTRPGRSGEGNTRLTLLGCTRIRWRTAAAAAATSTADDGGDEQSQVAVVELQGVEASGELELGLHHVAERPPEALEELAGDEASSAGHQEAIFVHAGGQEGKKSFVNAVLQERHLDVRHKGGRSKLKHQT